MSLYLEVPGTIVCLAANERKKIENKYQIAFRQTNMHTHTSCAHFTIHKPNRKTRRFSICFEACCRDFAHPSSIREGFLVNFGD